MWMIVPRSRPNDILVKSETTTKDAIHLSSAMLMCLRHSRNSNQLEMLCSESATMGEHPFWQVVRGRADDSQSLLDSSRLFGCWVSSHGSVCLGILQLLEGYRFVICFIHYYCRSSLIDWHDVDVGIFLEGGNGSLLLDRRWVAGVIIT